MSEIQEIEVEITLLVGSNGKVAACCRGAMGWGDLADGIVSYEGSTWKDPDASARYVVKVKVPMPTENVISAKADEVVSANDDA